jgi:hypothetical protein
MRAAERKVLVDRALNALEALPVDVALMGVRDQREGLRASRRGEKLTQLTQGLDGDDWNGGQFDATTRRRIKHPLRYL